MIDLIAERSDSLLLAMRRSPEKYKVFVHALLEFVTREPCTMPSPPYQNVTYVMDMLGERDMSFTVCLLSPEVSKDELCKISGLNPKQVAARTEEIRDKIAKSELKEYLLVPGKSVLAQADECGVPLFVIDLDLSPKLQNLLKRHGIARVSTLEALPKEKIVRLKGMTEELYIELAKMVTSISQAREDYRAANP